MIVAFVPARGHHVFPDRIEDGIWESSPDCINRGTASRFSQSYNVNSAAGTQLAGTPFDTRTRIHTERPVDVDGFAEHQNQTQPYQNGNTSTAQDGRTPGRDQIQ